MGGTKMNAKKIITSISILTITVMGFVACGKDLSSDPPFTTFNFDTTYDDMIKELGEPDSEKESYYGKAYNYSSDYLDLQGNVQYAFDEDGHMTNMTWAYFSEDGEEITDIYNDLHKQLQNSLGKTKEATNTVTNLADIWRLDSGNIELAAIVTSDYNVVMFTYLSPEYSTSSEEIEE